MHSKSLETIFSSCHYLPTVSLKTHAVSLQTSFLLASNPAVIEVVANSHICTILFLTLNLLYYEITYKLRICYYN